MKPNPSVVIVVPPFGPIEYPMMGPSMLRAVVEKAGYRCSIYYANIEFAARIGFDEYLSTYYAEPPILLGDRTFAETLHPGETPALEEYWRRVVDPFIQGVVSKIQLSQLTHSQLQKQRRAEAESARFVEAVAGSQRIRDAEIIGFSSSFGQHACALAIARRVKQQHPEKPIVFGGSHCEGEMGEQTLASYPFVDFVADGVADLSFPALVSALSEGRVPEVPGIRSRDQPIVAPAERPVLDDLPYPVFDDFFESFAAIPGSRKRIYSIPVEGARGCWWGAKHHCVFCGINGNQMAFERKSAERFRAEIDYLVDKYAVNRIWATDNILDHHYFQNLIPSLGEEHSYEEMFFEVKANLSREQLEALARAGITRLQPGIESLDTSVLRLMAKGTTEIQNIQLLKWAEELGITLQWNILCGFPGEDPAAYSRMASLARNIPHLPSPKSCSQISIDRFSPLYRDPERFGIEVEPARAYSYVYALSADALRRLAYFHSQRSAEVDTRESLAVPEYVRELEVQTRVWQRAYGRVQFTYTTLVSGDIKVEDSRPIARESLRVLSGVERDVFLATRKAVSLQTLSRQMTGAETNAGVCADEIEEVLGQLIDRAYLHAGDGKYLNLAIQADSGSLDQLPG